MLTIEGRGARDVAKRAHEMTGQVFRYAIAHDIADRNPAADFKPRDILAEAKEENFARVDAKDLPELLLKMESYDGDALTRLAMRLMAYTFVRTSELIGSEWSEFDLDDARWDVPAERMKMDTPHVVPLGRRKPGRTRYPACRRTPPRSRLGRRCARPPPRPRRPGASSLARLLPGVEPGPSRPLRRRHQPGRNLGSAPQRHIRCLDCTPIIGLPHVCNTRIGVLGPGRVTR
jgi:integrase